MATSFLADWKQVLVFSPSKSSLLGFSCSHWSPRILCPHTGAHASQVVALSYISRASRLCCGPLVLRVLSCTSILFFDHLNALNNPSCFLRASWEHVGTDNHVISQLLLYINSFTPPSSVRQLVVFSVHHRPQRGYVTDLRSHSWSGWSQGSQSGSTASEHMLLALSFFCFPCSQWPREVSPVLTSVQLRMWTDTSVNELEVTCLVTDVSWDASAGISSRGDVLSTILYLSFVTS